MCKVENVLGAIALLNFFIKFLPPEKISPFQRGQLKRKWPAHNCEPPPNLCINGDTFLPLHEHSSSWGMGRLGERGLHLVSSNSYVPNLDPLNIDLPFVQILVLTLNICRSKLDAFSTAAFWCLMIICLRQKQRTSTQIQGKWL